MIPPRVLAIIGDLRKGFVIFLVVAVKEVEGEKESNGYEGEKIEKFMREEQIPTTGKKLPD